jgi:hypothetical protein
MTLLAVALVAWLLLTLPAAVLMGKCIARGLEPVGAEVHVPSQRGPVERTDAPAHAQAARSQA